MNKIRKDNLKNNKNMGKDYIETNNSQSNFYNESYSDGYEENYECGSDFDYEFVDFDDI